MNSDTELLHALIDELHGEKWEDTFPWLRPRDEEGEPQEKYIDRTTFKSILNDWVEKCNIIYRLDDDEFPWLPHDQCPKRTASQVIKLAKEF